MQYVVAKTTKMAKDQCLPSRISQSSEKTNAANNNESQADSKEL